MRDYQQVKPAREQNESRYRSALVAFVLGALLTFCGTLSAQTGNTVGLAV